MSDNSFQFDFVETDRGLRQLPPVGVPEPDPELEALLDEEEEIARRAAYESYIPRQRDEPFVNRRGMLEEADACVNGDRNADYGDPIQDFRRTGQMWGAYLGVPVEPHDVAAMMCMLKVSRIRWSPTKRDNWVDLAGYAACGYDCSVRENL